MKNDSSSVKAKSHDSKKSPRAKVSRGFNFQFGVHDFFLVELKEVVSSTFLQIFFPLTMRKTELAIHSFSL